MDSWAVLLRGPEDSMIVRIWAHDREGAERIIADLHPDYRIGHIRPDASESGQPPEASDE